MSNRLLEIQKNNFDDESVEFAYMFLLIHQGGWYGDHELTEEEVNVIKILKENNVCVSVISPVNRKYKVIVQ